MVHFLADLKRLEHHRAFCLLSQSISNVKAIFQKKELLFKILHNFSNTYTEPVTGEQLTHTGHSY